MALSDALAAELPGRMKKDIQQVDASLYAAISLWMRKHGKVRLAGMGMGACVACNGEATGGHATQTHSQW